MLHLDANVRWGIRHIQVTFSEAPIDLAERIHHFALGAIMLLPILGHVVAAIEYALCGRISSLHLKETDPYRRGFEFGSLLKAETQFAYRCAKVKIQERELSDPQSFTQALDQLKRSIPAHMHEEMRGLSAGAGVPLEDVYKVHTFLDIYAGMYGCSAVASVKENGTIRRVAKTNHFGDEVWCERLKAIEQAPLEDSIPAHQSALALADNEDTVQSAVFDVNHKQLSFSSAWGYAAETIFSLFSFFKRKQEPEGNKQVFAAFNLDWPWQALSPYTLPVTFKSADGKKKFVNLTFPGYLGVLRGMNENGVVVGCCQSGSSRQDNGIPVTMLFRDLLENSSSVSDVERRLAALRPASSMNLVAAGRDGAIAVELDPSRARTGFAAIQRI